MSPLANRFVSFVSVCVRAVWYQGQSWLTRWFLTPGSTIQDPGPKNLDPGSIIQYPGCWMRSRKLALQILLSGSWIQLPGCCNSPFELPICLDSEAGWGSIWHNGNNLNGGGSAPRAKRYAKQHNGDGGGGPRPTIAIIANLS